MFKGKKIVCIIPARSGSKAIKDKNLSKLLGYPLIYFSIKQAMSSKYIDKIIFSSDSITYIKIARKIGLKINNLRPKKYATDYSKDIDLFHYELFKLYKENYKPDIYVNLRPTSPLRTHKEIDLCIRKLINSKADSIRSVTKNDFIIQKTWFLRNKYLINTTCKDSKKEEWNLPRQKLEESYMQNGNIDIGRVRNIFDLKSMTGKKIIPYVQNFFCDIDTKNDLIEARKIAKKLKILNQYL
tara:strand:+ start:456 stop:1178 length:723 start_codon:yes stop_codon:yes gene_type:complete